MKSLRGYLLIAAPELDTPFFARTVILMIDHDEDGAMGVVLNRPTDASASDLPAEAVGAEVVWDKALYIGGPVPGPVVFLHDVPELADREVLPGVSLTLDAEKARELLARQPEPSKIIANYSGWGAGQLEGEFEWDSWVTLPALPEHVFGAYASDEELWDAVVGLAQARKLSDFFGVKHVPPDPTMN